MATKGKEAAEMPAEVDFTGGVRGKYVGEILRDAVYVPLESDVAQAFSSAAEVNHALRMLMNLSVAVTTSPARKTD